ncbi:MAG: hypothetical protein LH624_15260, partial [Cryobacterium sp.]|nr:hypothetical protein [Cryobacterium sp.]
MTREKSAGIICVVREELDSGLALDALTGRPAALLLRIGESWGSRAIEVAMRASCDGTEHGGSHGRLAYRDTVILDVHRVRDESTVV